MLESLLEIEIAYSMMKADVDCDGTKDPLDSHYEQLKCAMQVRCQCHSFIILNGEPAWNIIHSGPSNKMGMPWDVRCIL